jgi:hypothetical protein
MTWLGIAMLTAGAAAAATFSNFGQSAQKQDKTAGELRSQSREEFESRFPIVNLSERREPPAEKRAETQAKEKKLKRGQLPITEYAGNIFTVTHWETKLPALPVTESQAVVIARVVDAKAHLSEDETFVYSEFTVKLDEVVKSDGDAGLAPHNAIAVLRMGGRVKFPSGHVTLQLIKGQNMPRLGWQYVLFLTRSGGHDDYQILTGFELRGDSVFLLDAPAEGHPMYRYQGADRESFLNDLRSAASGLSQS